jgi:hypothetical protein
MCLTFNQKATDALRKEYGQDGKLTCYKVLERCNLNGVPGEHLISPFFAQHYISGYNQADRKDAICENGLPVNHGIHVFLTWDDAVILQRKLANNFGYADNESVIVPVECEIADLIGVGVKCDAVFNRVYLTGAAYRAALA